MITVSMFGTTLLIQCDLCLLSSLVEDGQAPKGWLTACTRGEHLSRHIKHLCPDCRLNIKTAEAMATQGTGGKSQHVKGCPATYGGMCFCERTVPTPTTPTHVCPTCGKVMLAWRGHHDPDDVKLCCTGCGTTRPLGWRGDASQEKAPPVTKADVVPGTIIRHRNGRHFYIAGTDVTLDLAGNDKVDIDVHFYRLDGKAPMMVPVNPVRTTNVRKILEPGQYTVIAKNVLAFAPRDSATIPRCPKIITDVHELRTGDVVETQEEDRWLILSLKENAVTGVVIVKRQKIGEMGVAMAERADTMFRENSWALVGELVEFPKQLG